MCASRANARDRGWLRYVKSNGDVAQESVIAGAAAKQARMLLSMLTTCCFGSETHIGSWPDRLAEWG